MIMDSSLDFDKTSICGPIFRKNGYDCGHWKDRDKNAPRYCNPSSAIKLYLLTITTPMNNDCE